MVYIYMHAPSPNIFLTFFITDLSSWLFIFFGLLSIWQSSIILVITLDITIFEMSISISKCNQCLCPPPGVPKKKKKNPQCLNPIPTKFNTFLRLYILIKYFFEIFFYKTFIIVYTISGRFTYLPFAFLYVPLESLVILLQRRILAQCFSNHLWRKTWFLFFFSSIMG